MAHHNNLALRPRPTPRNQTEHADERFEASRAYLNLMSLPIYQLPAEILVHILGLISISDYPALIPGFWHLLRKKGIAATVDTPSLKSLLLWPRMGFFRGHEDAKRKDNGPNFIPKEVR